MRIIGVIPSRYGSTRLPGKPLKDICGKSMVQRVYEAVQEASLVDEVIVATDDNSILEEVGRFGGKAVMTSPEHPNGTSRIAEAVSDMDADLVVNIQGDEPFIRGVMIDELVQVMVSDPEISMATLCYEIRNEADFSNQNVVKVVSDLSGYALYFSRSMIPFPRRSQGLKVYEHLGIYGYRKDFLERYITLEDTPLARTESLEQLKVLEHGYRIFVVESKHDYQALSIDTPEDLEEARRILKERSL